jgi:hypothetical protein
MTKYPLSCFKHFIQQVWHANWTNANHLERIWLGIWCPETLKGLLLQSITSELTTSEQYIYIKITSKLTAPLIDTYHQMLDISVKSQGCRHYVIDHVQTILADSDQLTHELNIAPLLSPTNTLLSPESRGILEAMHIQEASSHIKSRLSHLDTVIYTLHSPLAILHYVYRVQTTHSN